MSLFVNFDWPMSLMSEKLANSDAIRVVLESSLARLRGPRPHIERLARRQYEYWSSCMLEELLVQLDDGSQLTLLFKDFSSRTIPETTRRVRDLDLFEPAREIAVYTQLLSLLKMNTAGCFAAEVDPLADRYWLFLEKVAGRELYQIAELSIWETAAAWLARFHCLATPIARSLDDLPLLDWDRSRYERCLNRARLFHGCQSDSPGKRTNVFDRIQAVYVQMIEQLLLQPKSVIHGEFYASNVLIRTDGHVCPIDWETAAWGLPLMDLAALIAGRWTAGQQASMVRAYWSNLDNRHRESWLSGTNFDFILLGCRLHLAVQMLGRPADWEAPSEHRLDWKLEAEQLALQLETSL